MDELKKVQNVDISINDIFTKNMIYDINNSKSYESKEYTLNILKNYNKDIIFSKYINSNIMYLYIMDYKTEDKTILIKIGYTSDLLEREKTLITEYSCNFYPVGFQHIHSEQDEKKFHKLIRNVYPHLINNLKINNKIKKEIYKYDEVLISEFLNYHLKINNLLLIEQEKTIQEKEKTN